MCIRDRSTTYRFAKHDKKHYPDIITANENGTPYYTNSSHLPVGYTEDIFSALEMCIRDRYTTRSHEVSFFVLLSNRLCSCAAAANHYTEQRFCFYR